MKDLKSFVSKVPNFSTLDSGNQIKYFVYYLQVEKQYDIVRAKDISECYASLHLNPYSNIPAFLNYHSRKGKTQQFLKKKIGFVLYSLLKETIDKEIDKPLEIESSDSLFPQSIFNNTKGYLIEFAKEASKCYDLGLYNSCLFLLRKITETLIIELYESKNLQVRIKNGNDDYFQLSELIKSATNEPAWKLTKIVKENLPKIKLLADSSVHSKRFSAKKPDIDGFKTNVRITFEELISHIDYEGWRNRI
jgi:hypothetical protein